jgi:hypothetical protein
MADEETPTPKPPPKKSRKKAVASEPTFEDIVDQVIAGDWGDEVHRARSLRDAGHSYLQVEAEVRRRQSAEE